MGENTEFFETLKQRSDAEFEKFWDQYGGHVILTGIVTAKLICRLAFELGKKQGCIEAIQGCRNIVENVVGSTLPEDFKSLILGMTQRRQNDETNQDT